MTGYLFHRFFLPQNFRKLLLVGLLFLPTFSYSFIQEFQEEDQSVLKFVKHYAPVIYQQVDPQNPDSNYITNFDFDGDFLGNNNWDNVDNVQQSAHVYYSAFETIDAYYLFYGFYHPRKYSSRCLILLNPCHENDFSGVMLFVSKEAPDPFGRLELVETYINGDFYTHQPKMVQQRSGLSGSHQRLALWSKAKNHDLYVMQEDRYRVNQLCGGGSLKTSKDDKDLMTQILNAGNSGANHIVYVYAEDSEVTAQIPEENMSGGILQYKLLNLKTEFFDKIDYALEFHSIFRKPFKYHGSRFSIDEHMVPAKFYGTKHNNNSASFPWAWFDGGCSKVRRGDWFFDPAYTVNTHFGRTINESDEYIYNPYLGIFPDDINALTQDQSDNGSGEY